MNIDRFKNEDGWFIDAEGLAFEDAETFMQASVFAHCCCGAPEASLRYLMGAMDLVRACQDADFSADAWAALYAYFNSTGEAYTVFYLLDNRKLTEHGSSVPGWLTDWGREVLADLKVMYPSDEAGS